MTHKHRRRTKTLKSKSQVKSTEKLVEKVFGTTYKEVLNNLKWLPPNSKRTFKYLAGINRPVMPGHVSTLARSFGLLGILRPIIVAEIEFLTGKSENYIIDGQHAFNALMRLGWEIPYVVIKIKDRKELIEKIALLNSSSKTWAVVDYVTAWASLEEDYIKLNKYYQVYDFELGILASIFSGNTVSSGGSVGRLIKSGEFRMKNEEKGVEILDYMTDVFKVVPRMNRYEIKYFCGEYYKFVLSRGCRYKSEHAEFIKWVESKKECLKFGTMGEGKLSSFFQEFTKAKRKRGRPRKK